MERAWSHLLTWMWLPVCAALVLSVWSLPRQPYTGLVLRDDWVAAVVPGSPAAGAGFRHGDRVTSSEPAVLAGPLARAAPGAPLALLRERDGRLDAITLVPQALPAGERRIMAALLALACGFVLLGGWVWSERRDRLTEAFLLLCFAFACLLAPLPRLAGGAALAYDVFYTAVTLVLPALCVQFFALFPGAGRARGRRARLIAIAWAVAAVLVAGATVAALLPGAAGATALALVQALGGVWFALGLVVAVALFARSYLRARATDARPRLRVALAGTILGLLPLAVVVGLRNLFPSAPLPGERWALAPTLLVPAGFAWAIVMHRVFEIRIALRAAIVVAALGLIGVALYATGEWLAAAWRPDLGHGIAGGALAFVALTASLSGPASRLARDLGARLFPDGSAAMLEALDARPEMRAGDRAEILTAACEVVCAALRLDGCIAVELEDGAARVLAGAGALQPPAVPHPFAPALAPGEVVALDDARLAGAAAGPLARAGIHWLLPLASYPPVLLLLGRGLGSWLAVPEMRELKRVAAHLEARLDNARLRAAARAHLGLDRAMSRAQAIQARLLPREMPAYGSLDCAAATLSCEAVSGDSYDFVQGEGGTLTLAVGDAAGKGVPAALVGTWAQGSFRTQARSGAAPGAVLEALNRELVAMGQPDAFLALLCARIEVERAQFSFANAGLTPPLVRRRDGRIEELGGGGVLLGVTAAARYADTAVTLDAGDMVLIYTDGLTEAQRGEELLGVRRVRQLLQQHGDAPASELVRELLEAARGFADRPLDDVTVVVLRQRAAPVQAARVDLQTALKLHVPATDT